MANWQHERCMTPRQIENAIIILGMSEREAGRFLGVSERTVRRYIAGGTMIPTSVVLLLWSMIAHGDVPVVPLAPRNE